jgi:hypothetical protein
LNGPQCLSKQRIDGKKVVVTGATSGIGFETALELARRGTITFHYTNLCNCFILKHNGQKN